MDAAALVSAEFGAAVDAIGDNARRRRIARRAVVDALTLTGLRDDPVVGEVLAQDGWVFAPDVRARVAQLAQRLDEAADLAEDADDDERQGELFRPARAASALSYLVSASPDGMVSDVLYEAFHAVDADESSAWRWLEEP